MKPLGIQTYNTKLLFDDRADRDYWVAQMSVVRDAYNYISNIAFNEKTELEHKVFHKRFYYEVREKFPELNAQMTIKVYSMVLANYRTAKDKEEKEKREKEREKKRKHKKGKKGEQAPAPVQQEESEEFLTEPIQMKNPALWLDKRIYSSFTDESIRLPCGMVGKRSVVMFDLYPKFEELSSRYRKCDPTILYREGEGEFYLCVPFAVPLPECVQDEYMGIDLGVKRAATLSDGTAYTNKEYLARRRKIRHNKSVFRRHKKHSHSARTKLRKNSRKERNVSKNEAHHLANWILEHKASVFVMEDLSRIKRNTSTTKEGFKKKRHNNMLSQVPFYMLRQILTYKAPLRGKRVETVSPYDTSKMDCRTQSKEGCVRKGCRFYTADGLVFDADWNAALNILYRKHPTSFALLPLDGRLDLVGRRRQHANRGRGRPLLQAAKSSA